MSYTVPNVPLIPQDSSNACWYACAQMLVRWRRDQRQQTDWEVVDPSEDAVFAAVHRGNSGLLWRQMRVFARALGLIELPLITPTLGLLEQWLRSNGPLWTDGCPVDASGAPVGTGHVVVIAGVQSAGGSAEGQILIHDPWPVNRGNVSWRPTSHLAGIQSGAALNLSRDVCFLALPAGR